MYFTHKYFSDNNNDLFKPLIYTTDTNYNYNLYSDYQLINNGPNNALERPRPLRGFTECLTACGLSGTRPSFQIFFWEIVYSIAPVILGMPETISPESTNIKLSKNQICIEKH